MSYDPLYDFDYFYAASSCLQQGSSPFGPCLNDELRELQHQDWRFARLRFLPVALYLIYPLAWTSRHLAAFAVTLVMLLCLWRSAALLADSLPLATRRLWIFGLALLFFPVLKSFYFGQISPLLLWVLLEARHRKGLATGALLSVGLALKPNIFGCLVLFFLSAQREDRSRVLLGLAAGGLIQLALSFLAHPGILDDTLSPSAPWVSFERLRQPTTTSLLYELTQIDAPWLIWALGLTAGVIFGRRVGEASPKAIPLMGAISCATSPYLWAHDLILLLPSWLRSLPSRPIAALNATLALLAFGIYLLAILPYGEPILVFLTLIVLVIEARRWVRRTVGHGRPTS